MIKYEALMKLTDEERNALIDDFVTFSDDNVYGTNLRAKTWKLYLSLMLVMTVCFL